MERLAPGALFAALAAGLALLLAPGADAVGSGPTGISAVSVIGSGPLEWKSVSVRAAPSSSGRVIAQLRQFRPDYRLQYVMALAVKRNADGAPAWYRISVPGRPNGRTGWIRGGSADIRPVDRHLVIYRAARRFEFWQGSKLARTGKVAVGATGMETPLGLFYVTAKFDPSWPILGAYAFETSGYSKLSDWPGGGVVGVHGTNTPWLLGHAVSHGCVRMLNANVLFLRSRVPEGTPVKIVP